MKIAKRKRTNELRDQKIQRKLKKEKDKIRRFSDKITSWLNSEQINKIAIISGYIKTGLLTNRRASPDDLNYNRRKISIRKEL